MVCLSVTNNAISHINGAVPPSTSVAFKRNFFLQHHHSNVTQVFEDFHILHSSLICLADSVDRTTPSQLLCSFNMAPYLQEPLYNGTYYEKESIKGDDSVQKPQAVKYVPGMTAVQSYANAYEYEDLKPSFPDIHWGPLTEVPYHDKALDGSPDFRNLLDAASDVFDYNPKIGTEIHGIRLTSLTDAQKNDLARLIATRGVVFFRNQDDFDIEAQRKLGSYFGKLHKHATTSVPRREGLEDVHVVFANQNSKDQRAYFTPTFLWHSDVS